MLSHIQCLESLTPIWVYSFGGNERVTEYLLHLSPRPMAYFLCAASQKNQTQHMRHTQSGDTDHERWGISTASLCWPPKHTQNMVFQYSVSRANWSQHNHKSHRSIQHEVRTSKYSIVMRDQRCLCREIHCIFLCFFWYGILSLTQISSIYDTILSEFAAAAIT
jgi:hypothetical protein